MPATSKAQQRAAGAALAAKRGEARISDLKRAARELYRDLTETELEDLVATAQDGLPELAPGGDEPGLNGKPAGPGGPSRDWGGHPL
jgi:hypothetical protein